VELRVWLAERDMDQKELARLTRISEAAISRAIKGRSNFTLEQAWTLAQLTRLPLKTLITGGKAQRTYKLLVDQSSAVDEIAKESINGA
jgi:transcriptional regulator with XRE-family HTH domain